MKVIIACSSLRDYVDYAQSRAGTNHPVIYLNKLYHRDPDEMREHIQEAFQKLPADTDTVLIAMGYCGGSWEGISARQTLVIPKIDDCVSVLLQTDDIVKSNLKQPDHLYVREKRPESFKGIFERMTTQVDEATKEQYHKDWQKLYNMMTIIDTGINDCRSDAYRRAVQEDADWLDAGIEYVNGGTYLLEKLFRGDWDDQFLVLQPGETVRREGVLV